MLRQIVSLSLAITGCTTLITINANAVSLTFTPVSNNQSPIPIPKIEPPVEYIPSPSPSLPPLKPPTDMPKPSPRPSPLPPLDIIPRPEPPPAPPAPIIPADPIPEENTPEPLTMLGAATALGYGIMLKRQSSKNKKS